MEAPAPRPAISKLDAYRGEEFDAVNDLNRLRDLSIKIKLDDATVGLIDAALTRNKQRRFAIAVVGEFKRGKSTFINALLGKEILPSDVTPCSATLNRVVYGYQPSVRIEYRSEDGRPGRVEEIGIDELPNYVTKLTPESEKTAAMVKEATVSYPLAFCRDNVEIIDTPGLNDDVAMTEVTLGVLPDVSAAILVIMATSPFSQYEADFLNNQLLLQDLGRVMFVVTGIDLIRKPADREKVIKTIHERITKSVDDRLAQKFPSDSQQYRMYKAQIGQPKIFGISGYLALEAAKDSDDDLMNESGFPKFRDALETFITETRGAVELQVLTNRIVAAANEIVSKLSVELGALHMQQSEFAEAYTIAIGELEGLQRRRVEESKSIEEAAKRAKTAIRPMMLRMEEHLKRAAEEAITQQMVRADDVANPLFIEKFGKTVGEAVQAAAKRISEDVQIEFERHLVAEVNRLGGFAAQISQTLSNIELQFVKAGAGAQQTSRGRSVVNTLAGGLSGGIAGGILAGYEQGGVAGAGVGGAAGITTAFAGAVALLAIGLPLTWPVMVAIGIVSTFASGGITRMMFANKRIETFKSDYRDHIFGEIETLCRLQRLDLASDQQIDSAFQSLREKILGEADTVIEQQRSTLDQLRSRKATHEAMREHMQQQAEEQIAEVQEIRTRAQQKAERIAKQITETIEKE